MIIIEHGKNQEEYDSRLDSVIKKLGEGGLTFNAKKSQFNTDRLTFVEMVLSMNGISCLYRRESRSCSRSERANDSVRGT